ncbi:hypothetical protein [Nocardia brevicatena]|uniref:hypothetical protein n=1 Tax=Nocardia brevicatena TaxID=37327 RepID=UPI0002E7A67D|nr:hypothetical protein [Nocardia brevicatena]
MSRDTLSLPQLSNTEIENLLESATPALRKAVLRGHNAISDSSGPGSFNSFIDAGPTE